MSETTGPSDIPRDDKGIFDGMVENIDVGDRSDALIVATEIYDESVANMMQYLREVKNNGRNPESIKIIYGLRRKCIDSYKIYIKELIADSPDATDLKLIAIKSIRETNNLRCKELCDITSKDAFIPTGDAEQESMLESIQEELPGNEGDIIDVDFLVIATVSLYGSMLDDDTETFLEMMHNAKEDLTPEEKRKIVLLSIGRGALDMTKIAVGVTIGSLIANYIINR